MLFFFFLIQLLNLSVSYKELKTAAAAEQKKTELIKCKAAQCVCVWHACA